MVAPMNAVDARTDPELMMFAGTFLVVSVALVVRCAVWLVGRLG